MLITWKENNFHQVGRWWNLQITLQDPSILWNRLLNYLSIWKTQLQSNQQEINDFNLNSDHSLKDANKFNHDKFLSRNLKQPFLQVWHCRKHKWCSIHKRDKGAITSNQSFKTKQCKWNQMIMSQNNIKKRDIEDEEKWKRKKKESVLYFV